MAIANSIRSTFRSLSAVRLLGTSIHVSSFPSSRGIPDQALMRRGLYLVDSVVLHIEGYIEVGLTDPVTQLHLDVFDLGDLQWSKPKRVLARTSS